jgi:chalcone isomerase-like protein
MAIESLLGIAAASAMSLPNAVQVGGEMLAVASCATRETLWIDHYVAALYVRPGDNANVALQDAKRVKALEIRLLNKAFMPAEIPRKYRRALESALDEETMERVRGAYRALRTGDVIAISYAPGPGVRVSVNGRPVAAAATHVVVEAILAAWADGKPVDSHLRTVLAKHPCRSLTG